MPRILVPAPRHELKLMAKSPSRLKPTKPTHVLVPFRGLEPYESWALAHGGGGEW